MILEIDQAEVRRLKHCLGAGFYGKLTVDVADMCPNGIGGELQ